MNPTNNRAQIHDVVRTTIVGLKPARSGWSRTKCEFCSDRVGKADRRSSFAFYFPLGFFKCFRCGIKGQLGGYVAEYKVEDFDNSVYHQAKAPEWFISSTDQNALTSLSCAPGIQYAESRGFDLGIRTAAGMGLCVSGKYQDSLIIPHADVNGEWWGFTARKWHPRCDTPYLYPDGMSRDRLFNDQTLQVDTDEPALLMEGVLDGLLYWPDCVGGLGKPIEAHVVTLKKARRPIAVVLDGDAWAEGERFMMRLRLEKVKAGAVRLPPGRDPNDTKNLDPGEIRRAALASLDSPRAVKVQETRT